MLDPLANQSSNQMGFFFSLCIFGKKKINNKILLLKTLSSAIHGYARQNRKVDQHKPPGPFYFSFIQQHNLL